MKDEKQLQLTELIDEIDIILSVKNDISKEEIDNFKDKFNLLSEYDIRSKIADLTEDNGYIEKFDMENCDDNRQLEYEKEKEETIKFDSTEINKLIEKIEEDKNDSIEHSINEELKNNYEEVNVDEENNLEEVIDTNKENNYYFEEHINEIITTKKKEYSFDENNIPEVSFIKAEIKYGQLSVEWGWPEEIEEVIVCCRMDRFPMGPKDLSAQQIEVKREITDDIGNYVINKAIEGNYYFSVYSKVNLKEKLCYSEGVRRLVVNKAPSEIFYEIKSKKTIFGKLKSAEIVISTLDKELNLPQFILVGKIGNMPLQKSDGENILNIDYQNITKEKSASIELPYENIGKNMYVKLFFLDDTNSKLYRIISPAKEKLYFK